MKKMGNGAGILLLQFMFASIVKQTALNTALHGSFFCSFARNH